MEFNQEIYNTIDRFLKGEMSAQEKLDFQKRMTEDSALKDAVETQQQLINGVRQSANLDIRQSLNEIHATIDTEKDAIDSSTSFFQRKGLLIGLISLIILALGLLYLIGKRDAQTPPTPIQEEEVYAARKPDWIGRIPVFDLAESQTKADWEAKKIKDTKVLGYLTESLLAYSYDSRFLKIYASHLEIESLKDAKLYQKEASMLLQIGNTIYKIEKADGSRNSLQKEKK